MPNEIIIRVVARNETKPVFDQVRRDAAALGDEVGESLTTRVTTRIEQEATSGGSGYARAGDAIGEAIGRRVQERVRQRVSESVEDGVRRSQPRDERGRFISPNGARSGGLADSVNESSFLSRMASLGRMAAGKLTGALGVGVSTFFSGDFITLLLKAVVGGGLIYTLSGVIGGLLSSAILVVLGGGVIGAGIAAAFKDPQIAAAAQDLKGRFGKWFADFGTNFVPGVGKFMERLATDMPKQFGPMLDRMGKIFGPLTEKLGDGLIGFLQNLGPGLFRAMEAAAPLIETLAESLPKLGDDIGRFFDHIKESGPNANIFFNDLLAAIGLIIRAMGRMIKFFTDAYVGIKLFWIGVAREALNTFDILITGAAMAFAWVPGMGPKLTRMAGEFATFRKKVNAELNKIEDETVTVTIRQVFTTVGNVAVDVGRLLGGRAHGGIQGAASGGARTGLTWVGEHGPELAELPPGTQVHSNPDSMRMAAAGGQGGGGGEFAVNLHLDGSVVARVMIDPVRRIVRNEYAGSAQAALGYGAG
jgi:hypothetical protein